MFKIIWSYMKSTNAMKMLQTDIEKYGAVEVGTWRWWTIAWRYFKVECILIAFAIPVIIYTFVAA